MKRRFWIIIFCFVLVAGVGSRELTLAELFGVLEERHPFVQQQELAPEVERKNQNVTATAQTWRLTVRPTFYYSQPVDASSFTPEELQQANLFGSAQRTFWSTGGRFSAEWSSNLTDQNLPTIPLPGPTGGMSSFSIGLNRFYKNRIFFNYSQPLWQNYKGSLDRLDYELADFSIQIAEYETIENKEQFFLQNGLLYLDWVLLREKISILDERLQLAQEQKEFVQEKRQAFLVDEVDVLRAEDAVRMAEQNKMLVQSQLNATKSELAIVAQSPDIQSMQPQFDLYDTTDLPPLEQAFNRLMNQSRTLLVLNEQTQRLQRLRSGFAEQKSPQLNANLGAGFVGGDNQFGNSLDISNPDIQLSLMFSYPLGTQAATVNEQKTQLQIRQLELQRDNVSLNLKSRLAALLIRINEMKNILQLNQRQIASARQRMQEEQKIYEQGRGQLNFVIQSRDNLQNAKLIKAENAAAYQKLLLQYRELTDQLLDGEFQKSENNQN